VNTVSEKGEEEKKPMSHRSQRVINNLGTEFVYIPPGTFLRFQHEVTLTKGYYMQATEVTQDQWRQVMGYNPASLDNCGDNCPVEQVSWYDTQQFIHGLNQIEGTDNYRLPTEAEWEYACRAGTSTRFYFGDSDTALKDYAWYSGNSNGSTHAVAQKIPNAWGLYDMHGNVWEWCQDLFREYPLSPVTDPQGPRSGAYHVIRGGSWCTSYWLCLSSDRIWYSPGGRRGNLGFRLVRRKLGMVKIN
jgi:formylglycine-generating enzyme required for sulfatase activity